LNRLELTTSESAKSTRKIKNDIFAIDAVPAGTSPNPNSADTNAIIKKETDKRSIA
jgi:uncharacterized repeat protein (TIGR01451 family)